MSKPRTKKITEHQCKNPNCGYTWWPKNPDASEPKNCPRCKSPNWSIDKPTPGYMK